jgi:hypothetical protein
MTDIQKPPGIISVQGTQEVHELRILKRYGFFGTVIPITKWIDGPVNTVLTYHEAPFFIADRSYEVIEGMERHSAAAAAACYIDVLRVPNGVAPGAAGLVPVFQFPFDMTGAANTIQRNNASPYENYRKINPTDSLCFYISGNTTGLARVAVTVYLKAI